MVILLPIHLLEVAPVRLAVSEEEEMEDVMVAVQEQVILEVILVAQAAVATLTHPR